ncbi:MAG: T9SS type A sorting domain-containing protein [bacterium]|nr:T9SS type A sorting domain-containing protein [bacterium]
MNLSRLGILLSVLLAAAEAGCRLTLYNILGQPVAELARGSFSAGTHRLPWSSESVGTGIYFLRLQSGAQTRTAKVVALK